MNPNLTWQHQVRTEGGKHTIILSGEIDMTSARRLQDAVHTAEAVTVDLAGVGFIDSTVISALVNARNTADRLGRRFTVINPAARVRRIMQVTGVLDVMTHSCSRGP